MATWTELAQTFSPRQVEAVRVLGTTGSVPETADLLGVTPTRIYAIFTGLARRLGVSPKVLRKAACERVLPISSTTRKGQSQPTPE